MRVGVVIPAFNAGRELPKVVRRAAAVVGPEKVIVVDDGSTDGSVRPDALPGVCVIVHPENRGKGEALKSGFREAIGRSLDAVVTLDADGQHDPERIADLVKEAEASSADIVVGSRMKNVGRMPWIRRFTNRTTSFLVSRLAGQSVEDSQSGFRLIRVRVLEALDLKTSRYDTESEMLIQAGRKGFRIGSLPIASIYRNETSRIRPWADTWRFIRLFFRSLRGSGSGSGR